MEVRTQIGIEVSGESLRYAEVTFTGEDWHLTRLGSCNFSFDVADAILDRSFDATRAGEVRQALEEALGGTHDAQLRLALHPNQGFSFFVPVEAQLSDYERAQTFLKEARTIVGPHQSPLHFVPQPLFVEEFSDSKAVVWYQINVLYKEVYARFGEVVRGLGVREYKFCSLETSVAKVIQLMHQKSGATVPPRLPFMLAMGIYDDHAEFLLCRTSNLHFSTFAETVNPNDCAIHATQMMERLNFMPQLVGQIYLYGNPVDITAFAPMTFKFGVTPQYLNPADLLGWQSEDLSSPQTLGAYVPCLGAALLA